MELTEKLSTLGEIRGEPVAVEAFQRKLKQETRNAFLRAWFIDFCLVYYFAASLTFLIGHMAELNEQIPFKLLLAAYLPLSVAVSFLWTKPKWSVGQILVLRTNSMLKGNYQAPLFGQWLRSFSGIFSIAILLLTVVQGWVLTEMSLPALFSSSGLEGARRIFTALVRPELSIFAIAFQAMVVTIFIALMATALAIPPAFLASFFMARNLMKHSNRSMFIYNLLRLFSNITRSVEPIIWAIVFSVWVGIGPFAGMLALMVHSFASLTKLYSEQIENIDNGPIEAIEATGANRIQVVWYAVVPQIVLPYLSFTIYRWDINIRMATIIGIVGGGGIGTLLLQYQGLAKWNEVGTLVIMIAVVVWVMDYLSARIREAIY